MRIVEQQAMGFEDDPAAMETDVRKQALHQGETNGQDLEVLSLKAMQPHYIQGNFPSARIELRCKPR